MPVFIFTFILPAWDVGFLPRCHWILIYFLIQRLAHLSVKFAHLVPLASQYTNGESSYRRQASNYKNRRANQLRFNNLRVGLLAGTGAVQLNEWTHGRARYEFEGKFVITIRQLHLNVLITKWVSRESIVEKRRRQKQLGIPTAAWNWERFDDRNSSRKGGVVLREVGQCRLTNQCRETNSRITGQFGIRGYNRYFSALIEVSRYLDTRGVRDMII